MAYVTLAELKTTLGLESETYADDDLTNALASASAAVDEMAGRTFGTTVSSTRLYETDRETTVAFNDMVAVSGVALDEDGTGTWVDLEATDYVLLPRNAALDGEPYTSLRLTPAYARGTCFTADSVVRITGTGGWPTVPDEIALATSILATRLVKRVREAPFGVAGVGADGVGIKIGWRDPDVTQLVAPYVRVPRLT